MFLALRRGNERVDTRLFDALPKPKACFTSPSGTASDASSFGTATTWSWAAGTRNPSPGTSQPPTGRPQPLECGQGLGRGTATPELVCEVSYDHLQDDRFRHGTHFSGGGPTGSQSRAPTTSWIHRSRPSSSGSSTPLRSGELSSSNRSSRLRQRVVPHEFGNEPKNGAWPKGYTAPAAPTSQYPLPG
ncbi:MAG: hypothetical protein QOJ44_1601 [Acidimicrobiaceae bacterium]|nr:hypothetical protein [Acidimicrobiaceae bacterium]